MYVSVIKTRIFFPLYHFEKMPNKSIFLFHLVVKIIFQKKTIPVLFLRKERIQH